VSDSKNIEIKALNKEHNANNEHLDEIVNHTIRIKTKSLKCTR